MDTLGWEERPFVALERMASYFARDRQTAQKYGPIVKAVEISNRDYSYRYKKYSDVRLVFIPEERIGWTLDICFFRAYENGKPAKTPGHLAWGPAAPESGDLAFVAGHPAHGDRFCTSADLEAKYGPLYFLHYKAISRLSNRLAEFIKDNPDLERHASWDTFCSVSPG